MSNQRIAAIILTKNEEQDLPACLESLQGLAGDVFVIDSGSTDRTAAVALGHGAQVLSHAFVNYASQFNWALENIPSNADWILRIDADERVSPELAESIRKILPAAGTGVTGLLVPRLTVFLGRQIRHGVAYPVWLLRLFCRGAGRCENTWMDEHIVLDHGTIVKVAGDLMHEIPKSLSEWIRKHDWYADRECKDVLGLPGDARELAGQPRARRALKHGLYLKLPLFTRAFLYWFYRYFLRLGFLDGKEGLIYHFLQAFWYRFLVDAKLYELKKAAAAVEGGAARAQLL
jgi:glycosyltransferase involved in cell wall biosynthesis